MARTCSTGINILVKEDLEAVFNNGLARIRVKETEANPQFIQYVFQSRDFVNYIYGISGGTSVQLNMQVGDLARLIPSSATARTARHRPHPRHAGRQDRTEPADERDAGGDGAGHLQVMVRGLRPRARPRRKAASPRPAQAHRRPLPRFLRGFRVGQDSRLACCRWGEIATLDYGNSLRGYDSASGRYRVFGTNGAIGWHKEALCSNPGIVIGRKGAYRGVHFSPEPFFVIDTAFYLKPKDSLDIKWAYYEILKLDINGMDSGSAIPSTSREDFYGILTCAPPPAIQERFGKIVDPLFTKKFANERESHMLAALRDALLPKLLSGEIRVGGVEKTTEPHLCRQTVGRWVLEQA